jgi:hypothetical protein
MPNGLSQKRRGPLKRELRGSPVLTMYKGKSMSGKALLVLQTCSLRGRGFGAEGGVGEVVFNTSMTGYQRYSLIRPTGQIVTMTYRR